MTIAHYHHSLQYQETSETSFILLSDVPTKHWSWISMNLFSTQAMDSEARKRATTVYLVARREMRETRCVGTLKPSTMQLCNWHQEFRDGATCSRLVGRSYFFWKWKHFAGCVFGPLLLPGYIQCCPGGWVGSFVSKVVVEFLGILQIEGPSMDKQHAMLECVCNRILGLQLYLVLLGPLGQRKLSQNICKP